MKTTLLAFLIVTAASGGEALAQTNQRPLPQRSMADLLADGFETQTIQIFKDKIWMRKAESESVAYICDRGRIGSAAFDAYRQKKYDQIVCSLAR